MNNEAMPSDFPGSWRQTLIEMQGEWDRLHAEIAQLRNERDNLSKALLTLLREESESLNEAEILAQIGREKPLREFLQEMRAHVAGN